MGCIKNCWDQDDQTGNYSCPQCRQIFTPRADLHRNTILAEVVEKLKETGLSGQLQEKICSTHEKLLEFYCRTDQKCVCYLCVMDEHRGHDTVSAAAGRTEKKTQTQQRLQEREKELQKLRQAVKSLSSSAHTAVQDTDRIFTELIHSIERTRSEVTELIRAQERAAVSQAEGLLERLEKEITELKRRDAELNQLSHTEDHIHFLQCVCMNPSLSQKQESRWEKEEEQRRKTEEKQERRRTKAADAMRRTVDKEERRRAREAEENRREQQKQEVRWEKKEQKRWKAYARGLEKRLQQEEERRQNEKEEWRLNTFFFRRPFSELFFTSVLLLYLVPPSTVSSNCVFSSCLSCVVFLFYCCHSAKCFEKPPLNALYKVKKRCDMHCADPATLRAPSLLLLSVQFLLVRIMAEGSISVSQDQFSCSVCLYLLKDPVTLLCGHSYCMGCIKNHWDQEDQTGIYSCPQCRQTFTARPALGRNTILAEVVEKLKETGCRQLQEKICSTHDKLLEVYCRTDEKCVCYLCAMDEHRGHDTVSAAAGRTEKQVRTLSLY
ncbi:TRI65 protein, partial [Atractosteus spatula]|nr:TRI65 protein [Atractosteus spatula]